MCLGRLGFCVKMQMTRTRLIAQREAQCYKLEALVVLGVPELGVGGEW